MRGRRAFCELSCNGISMANELYSCVDGFSYTDVASGSSDTIAVTLSDPKKVWTGLWMPAKGDALIASISCENWDNGGRMLCGQFQLDEISFSGPPDRGSIKGISSPANKEFRDTKRSQTWEEVTLEEVLAEISGRYGLAYYYDAMEIFIEALSQSDTADSAFLSKLCGDYGLEMKLYSWKIVVFDLATAKARPPAATIRKQDVTSWSWQTGMVDVYTGGELKYTDPYTEKTITAKVGGGDKILQVNRKADSQADAERLIQGALVKKNHGETQMSITLPGRPDLVAGQTVEIAGWGSRIDGKYYIDKGDHKLGGGYTTALSLSIC